MSFLAPSALWLLAAAIPIIILYMLKMRRKQVPVSSTLLWTRLMLDREANAPWQRLKRNLLLLLQLLILAALVLAAARPALSTPVVASGSVVVLLDASASMSTREANGTRFEAARRAVESLINGLPPRSSMTLISVGYTPAVLAASGGDKNSLRLALSKARATAGSADWQGAFALAAGALHGSQHSTTVIVSDGGLPQSGLPALPGEVRFVPTGSSDDNLAITALALRPARQAPQLFAEVTNYSSRPRRVLLSIYADQALLSARRLELEAGASRNLTLDQLPATASVYRAHISDPDGGAALDALPLDDTAFAVYQAASRRRVLLVSKSNLFLEQLLASLPGIQPFRTLPDANGLPQIPPDPFDLYVLDGTYADALVKGNLLFVNPTANPYFTVRGTLKQVSEVRVNASDLTRYVDWSNVHVLQAQEVKAPAWADVLVQAQEGPLVFAGETYGRRIASVNFDLRQSDLPVQVAFPILFSNLINYLVPPAPFDAVQSLQPGQSLTITTPANATQVAVATPSNRLVTYQPPAGRIVFSDTAELGFYGVNFVSSQDPIRADYFAVNLFDSAESDIRPRQSIVAGKVTVSASSARQVGQIELWQWPAALALILLLVEWQVYHRRQLRAPSLRRLRGLPVE